MLIRVVETTDDKFFGLIFPLPEVGTILKLGDIEWNVDGVQFDEKLNLWKIWNFNYYALLEEVKGE